MKMKNLLTAILTSVLITGCVNTYTTSEGETITRCENGMTLNRNGTITMQDGTQIDAYYYLNGLNHRWDFGEQSFIIKQNGRGYYYDFNMADEDGMAKSQYTLNCDWRNDWRNDW